MRAGGRLRTVSPAVSILAGVLLLTGCGTPTLLDSGQLPEGEYASGNSAGLEPGVIGFGTCTGVRTALTDAPTTEAGTQGFLGNSSYVGASLFTVEPGQGDALDANLARLDEEVRACQDEHEDDPDRMAVSPLDTAPLGTRGWEFSGDIVAGTAASQGDEIGQLVVERLNDQQLLAVGLSYNINDGPPIALEDLVGLARQGAQQFPPPAE